MSQVDDAFKMLEAAAIAGVRCPFSDQVPGGSHSFGELARAGRILVEVYDKNFRRITILEGSARGKHTLNAPKKRDGREAKPYLTVDKSGTRRNGALVDTGFKSRTQPSAPRSIGVRDGVLKVVDKS
jgi:hypothetical protein